ncbi:MAG: hypothetical protein M3505_00895 [Verrucomicrobiota bacterium]|nr:hypothetical protein [Verrucomicrobiota bacterium]
MVGLVVLVIGGLAAGALASLVRGAASRAGLGKSRLAAYHCPRGGLGVCHCRSGESNRRRRDSGQHSAHGHGRRTRIGARPRLWPRRTRDRWRDPAQLFQKGQDAAPRIKEAARDIRDKT